MKLRELLLSKGWSEDQINAAFADKNTLAALDDIFGTVTSERDTLKAKDEAWQRKLDSEYNPAITKAEQDAATARREAADLKEQIRIAKDYGYLEGNEAEERLKAAAAAAASRNDPSGYDPKRHPTFDDVSKFAEAEGEAIALMNDLVQEYRYYTGKDMFEYEAQLNGQTLRGARALRQEAKAQRKPLDQYVAEKFDFAGARRRKSEEQQKAHDDKIRQEASESARREMAEKYGNPALAIPTVSRQPFVPTQPADGKQPWDRGSAAQLREERIKRAANSQTSGAAN